MRRPIAAVGALAVGALLALLIPGPVLGAPLPRAELHGFTCQRGLDPVDRSVGVTAVMRPLSATRHLLVRFDLLVSRHSGGPEQSLHAGDLGVWIHPENPTLGQLPGDVWKLEKSVVDVAAPDVYRFRVRFRWIGAHGAILATATRYSRSCAQPELRPDLQVRSIAVSPVAGHPSRDLYTAQIANAGNSAAGPFAVLFAPGDGSATTTHTVPLLRAHSTRTESFVGPVCSTASAPTITADSADQVDDLNRANNALTATCPS